MSYKLEFEEHALKEFKKLGAPVREQFTKKLKEVLQNPHVPANRLHGMADCYKKFIKQPKTDYKRGQFSTRGYFVVQPIYQGDEWLIICSPTHHPAIY
ncbi:type II toxin-antitoxin system RelE family toxin [Pectobacterium odoriferum]|uniref:type II toxin-antitoxin system RelE family toxin n=1 Tax=Pectobacterium odoriferum TaxID=78398 RepID=UPI0027E4E976|nr:hypothetical protein [Pectobacterium odoriferum]